MGSGATRFRTRSSAGATRFENEENIHCCLFHSRKYLLLQFYLRNTVVRTREPYIAFCFTRVSHDVICIQIAEIVICKHIRPFSNDMICIKIVKIVNMNSSISSTWIVMNSAKLILVDANQFFKADFALTNLTKISQIRQNRHVYAGNSSWCRFE